MKARFCDMLGVPAFGALAVVAALLPTACVSKVRYEACISDAERARSIAETKQRDDAGRIHGLEVDLAAVQATVQDRDSKLSDLSTANHNAQTQLDEATAINQQLRSELTRLGKDVDKMLSDRGTLSKALDDAKSRLDELRKAQAAAQSRIELFRELAHRFKPMVDAGQVRIETRRGQPVLQVSGDLLFEAGRSELRTAGKGALMEVAHALQTGSPPANGRRFLVTADVDSHDAHDAKEGQTRSAPRGQKSAWDITAARSVAVVEYLVSLGVPAPSLTAAAAGSFDPVATESTPDSASAARNRRVEIALLPSESELLAVPSDK
jgi:chemotaxis protein MotB